MSGCHDPQDKIEDRSLEALWKRVEDFYKEMHERIAKQAMRIDDFEDRLDELEDGDY